MEPGGSESNSPTRKANDPKNKGKEVEITPSSDSKKRKMSWSSYASLSSENLMKPSNHLPGESVGKNFACKFCDKKFLTFQALGGHQNAHRKERALAKGERNVNLNPYGIDQYNFHPFPSMRYFHFQPYRNPIYPVENIAPPIIPGFPRQNYGQPNIEPDGFDFSLWINPRVNHQLPNANPNVGQVPLNVAPDINEEVCEEFDQGQELGAEGSKGGENNNPESSDNEDGSIDLNLKL